MFNSDSDVANFENEGGSSGVSESKFSSGEKLPQEERLEENPPAHADNLSALAKLRNSEVG